MGILSVCGNVFRIYSFVLDPQLDVNHLPFCGNSRLIINCSITQEMTANQKGMLKQELQCFLSAVSKLNL